MRKFIKLFILVIVLFITLTMTGCFTERTADKINKKAEKDDPYTYEEVIDMLGDSTFDFLEKNTKTGYCVWISGCKDYDTAKKKHDDGKTLNSLTVTFVLGKATDAKYSTWDGNKK